MWSVLASALLLVLACGASHAQPPSPPPAAPPQAESRWEKAIQAFEDQDRASPPPQGAILFVGSSSIRMWDLKKHFGDLPAINRGFGGSTTAEVTQFIDRIVLPYKPKNIVFYAGDNDIAGGKNGEAVCADFKIFVEKVQTALPEARILYLSIKLSKARWKLADTMRDANRRIEAFCKTDKRLTYVDVATCLLTADGTPNPELFLADGLHLNEKGYTLWSEIVRPLLAPEDDAASPGADERKSQ